MKIVVITSNDYLHLLKIYCFLFNKFWSEDQEVNIVGFDKPNFKLPSNFNFISLGKQRGISYYGDDLTRTMELFEDDFIIQMPENEFIIRPVNKEILSHLSGYLAEDVGRIDLTPGVSNRPHTIVESLEDYDVIESSQTANYRIAMRASIWNRNYFKKHARGFAAFEIQGSINAINDGMRILSTKRDYACRILDGCQNGRGGVFSPGTNVDLRATNPDVSHHGLRVEEEIIEEMKSLGIIEEKNKVLQILN